MNKSIWIAATVIILLSSPAFGDAGDGTPRKVTIALMIDYSESMEKYIALTDSAIEAFTEELVKNKCTDWEVGVGTIDAVNDTDYGEKPSPLVTLKDPEKYTRSLEKIHRRITSVNGGNPYERPVDAIVYLLDGEGAYYATRDYTAVIVISDALEYRSKNEVEDAVDVARSLRKVGIFQLGIDPALESRKCAFDNQIEGEYEKELALVGSGRANIEAEFRSRKWKPPFSVEEIVKRTGGTFVHMCSPSLEAQMRVLAKAIADSAKCVPRVAQTKRPGLSKLKS